MAIIGGSSIVRLARRVAKLVRKHSAAGVLLQGGTAPAVAALVLMADIFSALDAAGAFDGAYSGELAQARKEPEMDPVAAMSMTPAQALEVLGMAVNSRKLL